MSDKTNDDPPVVIMSDQFFTEVTYDEQGNASVGPFNVVSKSQSHTHLPPDEYAHVPVTVYKNGKRIVIGEAILSGSQILSTVQDSELAREIIGHAFRTEEVSLGPIGIPRPRKKSGVGDPRKRFNPPRNIEPRGIYGQRGK